MAILSNGCKPDNFESHNCLKLRFTNMTGLCSDFVKFESFLDSGNFSVRGYLPLIRKDSSTHMHGLPVYVKEWAFFCTGLISRTHCGF